MLREPTDLALETANVPVSYSKTLVTPGKGSWWILTQEGLNGPHNLTPHYEGMGEYFHFSFLTGCLCCRTSFALLLGQ